MILNYPWPQSHESFSMWKQNIPLISIQFLWLYITFYLGPGLSALDGACTLGSISQLVMDGADEHPDLLIAETKYMNSFYELFRSRLCVMIALGEVFGMLADA